MRRTPCRRPEYSGRVSTVAGLTASALPPSRRPPPLRGVRTGRRDASGADRRALQVGRRDAERLGEEAERVASRVLAPPLVRVDGLLADAGPLGELLPGPAMLVAQLAQPDRRARQRALTTSV